MSRFDRPPARKTTERLPLAKLTMREGLFDIADALREVAAALRDARDAHRDVKPSNVDE